MRTYIYVWRSQLCFVGNVIKPGCIVRLREEFRSDQSIIIIQLLISGFVKAVILAASFVIPFEHKVILIETHDAVSNASTVSMEEPDDKNDPAVPDPLNPPSEDNTDVQLKDHPEYHPAHDNESVKSQPVVNAK